MTKCPICDFILPDPIPSFCSTCGWDLKNDPTLFPFITDIPDEMIKEYQQRFSIAKKIWDERISGIGAINKLRTLEKQAENVKYPENEKDKTQNNSSHLIPNRTNDWCNNGRQSMMTLRNLMQMKALKKDFNY